MQAAHPAPLATDPDAEVRVSTLELFFDLVFVFTITQVSHLILHAHGLVDIGRAMLVLTMIWWMYGGYAWLTNNVGTAQPLNRFLVLMAMACFMVMALAVPQAMARDGLAFGLAYLLVNLIHAALFTRSPDPSSAQAIRRIAPFNIGTALLLVAAGLIAPAWSWVLWVAAVAILALLPLLRPAMGFRVQPVHFVERHGLVLIIAFGESVISIGLGAEGQPVTLALVLAAVLTLVLIAALWWSFFSQDDQLAEHALSAAPDEQQSRMALYAFGYAQLVMIAGVVILAAGIRHVIEHPHTLMDLPTSIEIASGSALYLVGDVLFRRALRIPARLLRLLIAAGCLATIPLGLWAGGIAQVMALVALLVIMLGIEHVKVKRAVAS